MNTGLRVGLEIEFTNVHIVETAELLAYYFHSKVESIADVKHPERISYNIKDFKGNTWTLSEDHSIMPIRHHNHIDIKDTLYNSYQCELVTPVIETIEDFRVLEDILLLLNRRDARVNESCGCHIHIDNREDDIDWLNCIFKQIIMEQELVFELFNVDKRRTKYCKPYYKIVTDKFLAKQPESCKEFIDFLHDELEDGIYYKNGRASRYFWVNFDSISQRNTIEFRLFNSTLDIDMLKYYLKYVYNFVVEVDNNLTKDSNSLEEF